MQHTAKVLEREERIVAFLKEKAKNGEAVTKTTLSKYAGVTPDYTGQIVRKLMKTHKEIQNLSSQGVESVYKWVEDKPEPKRIDIPEAAPVAAAPLLFAANHPIVKQEAATMTAVLNASEKTGKILPGEVWQTEESNGTKGMIFALNSLNNACQGIKLYPDTEENRTIVGENPFSVDILGRTYLGDPTHVTFKPLKYCTRRRLFTHTDKLKEAREALAKVFGIPKQEVIKTVKADPEVKIVYRDRPVEKEPEKKEEVKVPDTYVDGRSAYIVTLERELDIWKTVAMKLLDKNS